MQPQREEGKGESCCYTRTCTVGSRSLLLFPGERASEREKGLTYEPRSMHGVKRRRQPAGHLCPGTVIFGNTNTQKCSVVTMYFSINTCRILLGDLGRAVDVSSLPGFLVRKRGQEGRGGAQFLRETTMRPPAKELCRSPPSGPSTGR